MFQIRCSYIEAEWRIYASVKHTNNGSDRWLVAWPVPSHYLSQCWDIVDWALGNNFLGNLNRNLYIFIHENPFENGVWTMAAIWSRPQCVNHYRFWSWWRHQMETFSALLALCAENSPVTGEFPSQRPVTQSFDVFFDLRLNKRLSKHSRRRWFETPSCSLLRHSNDIDFFFIIQSAAVFAACSAPCSRSPNRAPNRPSMVEKRVVSVNTDIKTSWEDKVMPRA